MRKRVFVSVAGLLLLALAAGPAGAVVVFSQPAVDGGNAWLSDFPGQEEADNLVLQQDELIHDCHWWGVYPSGLEADDFVIRFFNDDGTGRPAINPFVQVTPVNLARQVTAMLDITGGPIYYYSADLSADVSLAGGVTYYLSVVNATQGGWYWSANGQGNHFWRSSDGDTWMVSSHQDNVAFELTTEDRIPEPASLSLLALGGLGLLRRRRKR